MNKNNWRSFLLIAASILITSALFAQDKPDRKLSVGLNLGPVVYANTHPNDITPKPGALATVSAQYNFTSRFAIRAELNYEQDKHTITFEGIHNTYYVNGVPVFTDIPARSYTYKLNVLTLPVMIRYNIMLQAKTSIFVNVGSYAGIVYERISQHSDLKLGALAGVGIRQSVNERLDAIAEIRGRMDGDHILSGSVLFGIGYKL